MPTDHISYKSLLDNLYDGVYFVDLERKITYWNKSAERLTGYAADEIIGKYCWNNILRHINDEGVSLCEKLCPLVNAMKEDRTLNAEVFLHHKDGHRVPVLVRVSPIKNSGGNIIGAVEVFSDNSPKITLQQRVQELQNLTLLDALTETGNRRYAEITLRAKVDEMQRYDWICGILFIDIDHFKNINDIYGHDAGDQVLKAVSKTLQSGIRTSDILSRWGGEEFVAVISSTDEEHLLSMAERLRLFIAQSDIPIGEHAVHVTVSIGATLVRPGDTPETALRRSDSLMYESKKKGRNMVSFG
jgi:diguanylate cyclase (GGDEF)-like protein/PAS domain S-box-containing protein